MTDQVAPTPFAVNGRRPTLNTTRIVEAMVIAGLCALATGLFTQALLGERLENLSKQMQEVKIEIRQIRDDFYAPKFMKQP